MCLLSRSTTWALLLVMNVLFVFAVVCYVQGVADIDSQGQTPAEPAAAELASTSSSPRPRAGLDRSGRPGPGATAGGRPSLSRPFVFFHVPKVGGTSLRKRFHNAFKGEVMVIPGEGGLSNDVYEWDLAGEKLLNRTACAVAFLGHFKPGNLARVLFDVESGLYGPVQCSRGWPQLPGAPGAAGGPGKARRRTLELLRQVECLVLVREPLARLSSDYYHKRATWPTADFGKTGLADAVKQVGADRMVELTMGNIQSTWLAKNAGGTPTQVFSRQCKAVPHEMYDEAMSWLGRLYPDFSGTAKIRALAAPGPREGGGGVEALSSNLRLELAERLAADGAVYAAIRDSAIRSYSFASGRGAECGGMCWNATGGYWLPQGHGWLPLPAPPEE